jgi:hypothetical protein
MRKFTPWLLISILVLMSVACSFTVNLPSAKTEATQEWTTRLTNTDAENIDRVTVQMGAGTLNLIRNDENFLDASVRYNVMNWKPSQILSQKEVILSQGNVDEFKFSDNDVVNDWDIALGGSQPIRLTVDAGAYKGSLDLSAIPLSHLEINDGASQAKVLFSSLNPAEMDNLVYKTGASEVSLIGLSNANVDQVTFQGGAGSYTLDFSGDQSKDMDVSVEVGVCNLRIIIPENMGAVVTVTGGLNNIDPSGSWDIQNSTYIKTGDGAEIHISVEMGLGNLELISEKSGR